MESSCHEIFSQLKMAAVIHLYVNVQYVARYTVQWWKGGFISLQICLSLTACSSFCVLLHRLLFLEYRPEKDIGIFMYVHVTIYCHAMVVARPVQIAHRGNLWNSKHMHIPWVE